MLTGREEVIGSGGGDCCRGTEIEVSWEEKLGSGEG